MKGLPYDVKTLLGKARDSALLAVETYNRPSASFRSGAYIVLMVLAWSALFHAIFLRRKIKPYYRKTGSTRYQKIKGEYHWWDLNECLRQFYKDQNPALRKNLEFFIELRNKIEHRSLPQLDPEIFGECQSMLINFESLLCEVFGERYAIKGGLSFALQFSGSIHSTQATTVGRAGQKSFRAVRSFIDAFRSSLSTEVQSDMTYSFKVFLVPKIGNYASKDAVAVEFVKYDPTKPEEMKQYEKVVAFIKPKEVRIANQGLLKPGEVVKKVAAAIGRPFKMHQHVKCHQHFNVRPSRNAKDPAACDTRYCFYDSAHRDYLYTPEWVNHLVKTLSDPATYDFLLGKRAPVSESTVGGGKSAA